jgi:hypothetical protein
LSPLDTAPDELFAATAPAGNPAVLIPDRDFRLFQKYCRPAGEQET